MAEGGARRGGGWICEGCGYALEGLQGRTECPECGLSMAASAAERRVGSAWQREPRVASWLATCGMMLTRPGRVFEVARLERPRATRLMTINVFASALMVFPLAVDRTARVWPVAAEALAWSGRVRAPSAGLAIWQGVAWLMVASAVIAAGLMLLTLVEERGLVLLGRRRGWRVTPTVARVVCAHASIGWAAAVALGAAGVLARDLPGVQWLGYAPWLGPAGPWVRDGLWAIGFVAGMLVFETLAYVGFVRMRFANGPNGGGAEPDR